MKEELLGSELMVTTLTDTDMNQIKDHVENVITSLIFSNLKDGCNEVSIDVGFGKMYVRIFSDDIFYQFEPSETLQEKLKQAVVENENPLVEELKKKIDKKLFQVYKELLR